MARWILKLTGYALLAAVFALCLYTVPPTIESDLLGSAKKTLRDNGLDWALVSIDGRDITLSGSPPDQQAARKAVELLRQTTGVRQVLTTWSADAFPDTSEARQAPVIDLATISEPTDEPASAHQINLPLQPAPDQEFDH